MKIYELIIQNTIKFSHKLTDLLTVENEVFLFCQVERFAAEGSSDGELLA